MKTSKPISTISFNTEAYLVGKLKELTKAKIIQFWAYIHHDPEPDEVTDETHKEHFHVYMEPAILLQTMDLKEQFKEPDPTNEKPLGCIEIIGSKFSDWYMYGLHDADYLRSKGQARCFAYTPEDFRTSDPDTLKSKVANIDLGALTPYKLIEAYQHEGLTFRDFIVAEGINIQAVGAYERAWNVLTNTLDRNGRKGHKNAPNEGKKQESVDG